MARPLSNVVYLASPRDGVDGRGLLAKARAPQMTDGRIGDFWFDSAAKKIYGPKNAAEWPDLGMVKGDTGWSPLLAAVGDGARRVFRVVDWTGGQGSKPATGKYLGSAGLVDAIGDALDFRGEAGPQALIDELGAASGVMTDATQIAVAEDGDENEKRTVVEVFDPGTVLERLSVAAAIATTVRQAIKRIRTQYYSPDGGNADTFVGGAHYRRTNSQPSHSLKFRSTDRYTAEGSIDSSNGGWWELDEMYPTLEMAGGIGNGSSPCQTPYDKLLTYGRPICLLPGRTYLVTNPANPNGLPIIGQGKLVTAVTGGFRQWNSFADAPPRISFGHEYLERCYQFMRLGQQSSNGTLNVHLFMDSRGAGGFGEYHSVVECIKKALRRAGIPNVVIINHSVGGRTWGDLDAIGSLGSTVGLFIFMFDANDAGYGLATYISNIRSKLAAIREAAYGDVAAAPILIVGGMGTADSPASRDERWYETINQIERKAARDYLCAYFDGYAYMRDARPAGGSWMDNLLVHPAGNMNARFWGGVMNEMFPPYALAPFANNWYNNEGALTSAVEATDAPSTYDYGMSFYRATSGNGWPLDGVVINERNADGPAMQRLFSYGADSNRILTRTAALSGDGWNQWTGQTTLLTLLNGWSNISGLAPVTATLTSSGQVVLQGNITGGTTSADTVLCVLPAGMRPSADVIFSASIYSTTTHATIRVKPNGEVVGNQGLSIGITSLAGITFIAG